MAIKVQKNMRIDSDLVQQFSDWAQSRNMTFVAAAEYAMRYMIEQDSAFCASAGQVQPAGEPGISSHAPVPAGTQDEDSYDLSATLRDLMTANAQLTRQLGEAHSNANEASRNLLAATLQIKSLPSSDEVSAREKTARTEGLHEGLAQGRKEREQELAGLGLFGYLSWRRNQQR